VYSYPFITQDSGNDGIEIIGGPFGLPLDRTPVRPDQRKVSDRDVSPVVFGCGAETVDE
jgi:hypothetical protein